MMPSFPKAKAKMKSAFRKEILRASLNVCPVLQEIRVRPQTEGKKSSYERQNGEVVEMNYRLHKFERSWKPQDAQGLTPEEFFEAAAEIGTEMGERMMSEIISTVSREAEAIGNVVNCQGKDFTFETYLKMIADTYTDFDPSGRPSQKCFLASPEICGQLERNRKIWASDPAKCAALEHAMEQHRKAYNEREARRRMVD